MSGEGMDGWIIWSSLVIGVVKAPSVLINWIKVNDLARNSSMIRRALRTRSQRAYLASAIFVLILIIALTMIGLAISKKTGKFEDFEKRLRSLEHLQGRKGAVFYEDFDKRLRGLQKKLDDIRWDCIHLYQYHSYLDTKCTFRPCLIMGICASGNVSSPSYPSEYPNNRFFPQPSLDFISNFTARRTTTWKWTRDHASSSPSQTLNLRRVPIANMTFSKSWTDPVSAISCGKAAAQRSLACWGAAATGWLFTSVLTKVWTTKAFWQHGKRKVASVEKSAK